MPIIEGKNRRPVLSSNIDPIIEISDGSTLLIDPLIFPLLEMDSLKL